VAKAPATPITATGSPKLNEASIPIAAAIAMRANPTSGGSRS
jgi:hypothetical protein